jgi:hypothetical protein
MHPNTIKMFKLDMTVPLNSILMSVEKVCDKYTDKFLIDEMKEIICRTFRCLELLDNFNSKEDKPNGN